MKEVIKYMKPRIVKIQCLDINSKGTGFIINSNGLIATCFHVITQKDGTYSQDIKISNSKIGEHTATISHDKNSNKPAQYDYAILKINKSDLDHFELVTNKNIEEGEQVYFGGFPLLQDNLTCHEGHISSIRRTQSGINVMDVDGTVVAGNSGGPLLIKKDNKFKVVGIISQQVAYMTKNFNSLKNYLKKQKNNRGGVFIGGVNPNAALLEIIEVLKNNISTGIGTAISINYLEEQIKKNKIAPCG